MSADKTSEFVARIVSLMTAVRDEAFAADARLADRIGRLEAHVGLVGVERQGAVDVPRSASGRPRLRHCGSWESDTIYKAGDAVLVYGDLFAAPLNNLRSRPDGDPVGWVRVHHRSES